MTRMLIKGPLYLILGNIFYTLSFSLVKILSGLVGVELIMFIRFLAGPACLIPYFWILKKTVRIEQPGVLCVRIICGLTAMYCLFMSFKLGGLGKSMLIFECSTIWSCVLATILFKERLHVNTMLAIPVALAGIFLIIQPSDLMTIQIADGFALLGSFLNAGVYLSLKELRKKHSSAVIVLVTYSVASLAMVGPSNVLSVDLTLYSWLGLILMAGLGLIGQLLMTSGFRFAPASVSSLMMISSVPMMMIAGTLFFSEQFNQGMVLGAVLVVSSLVVISRFGTIQDKKSISL